MTWSFVRIFACCAVAGGGLFTAVAASAGPELKGILATPTQRIALFEKSGSRPGSGTVILSERQREEDIAVTRINPKKGTVEILRDGTPAEVGFTKPLGAEQERTANLRLEKAGPELVFRLYETLTKLTLLRPTVLPTFEVDLVCFAESDGEVAEAIESALANKAIVFRPHREKFVLAGTQEKLERVSVELWELASKLVPSGVPTTPQAVQQVLPAGAINFQGADLFQFLQIFEELTQRTVLRPTSLAGPTLVIHSAGPLTRAEAAYAFCALLALNGVSIAPAGNDYLLVFPSPNTNQVVRLLERKGATAGKTSDKGSETALSVNLSWADLNQVAALYAKLAGEPVEVSPSLPNMHLTFRSQKNLSPEAVLHGLELLLGLNGLRVQPKDPGPGLAIVDSTF